MDGGSGWPGVRTAFGVDVQGDRLCRVRAVRKRSGIVLTPVGPDAPAREDTLPVACAMGTRDTVIRRLAVPFASVHKARRVLPSVLDVELPFPLDECIYRFMDLRPSPDKGLACLAVAVRRTDILRRLETLRSLGCDPWILDSEGLALWHELLRIRPAARAGTTLRGVIYAGKDRVVVAVGKGDVLESVYTARPDDPARLRRIFGNWAEVSVRGAADWAVCGPDACGAAAKAVADILDASQPGLLAVLPEPEGFLARALAVRCLQSGDGLCNFRVDAHTHPGIRKQALQQDRYALLRVGALALLLGALSLGTLVFFRIRESRYDAAFHQAAEWLAPGVAGPARGQYAIRRIADHLKTSEERTSAVLSLSQPSRLSVPAALAGEISAMDVWIEKMDIGDTLQIQGSAPSWNVPLRLKAVLEAAGWNVRLDRHENFATERVQFTLTAGGAG